MYTLPILISSYVQKAVAHTATRYDADCIAISTLRCSLHANHTRRYRVDAHLTPARNDKRKLKAVERVRLMFYFARSCQLGSPMKAAMPNPNPKRLATKVTSSRDPETTQSTKPK